MIKAIVLKNHHFLRQSYLSLAIGSKYFDSVNIVMITIQTSFPNQKISLYGIIVKDEIIWYRRIR